MLDTPRIVSGNLDIRDATALLQRGYDYWTVKACHSPSGIPTRAEIDPADIPELLPNIVLTHVLRDPLDFIERITGDTVLEHSHRNSMNIRWRDFPGRGPDSALWQHFKEVVTFRIPRSDRITYVGPQKDFKEAQVVTCPLSDDGELVNKTISFVDYLSLSHER